MNKLLRAFSLISLQEISRVHECGVNLHYVKVGLSRRVREGPSVVLGGIFFAQSGYPTGPGASESK